MQMKHILFSLFAVAAFDAMAAYPTVSQVSAVQRWPVSSEVDVYFTVGDDGDTCDFDIVATWKGQTAGKTIGTLFAPGAGRHHYVWHTESLKVPAHDCSDIYDPVTWKNCTYQRPETKFSELSSAPLEDFRVEIRPATIVGRLFLDINLKTGEVLYGATSPVNLRNSGVQAEHLTFRRVRAKDDAGRTIVYTNGYSQALRELKFPKADSTWGAMADDPDFDLFKGQFTQREVTFSADYFILALPNTSGMLHYMYRNASYFVGCNSVKQRSYEQLRGTVAQGINWPYSGFKVAPTSDIAQFREFLKPFVGNMILDLPTRAQLETAMRAGTDGNQMLAPDPSLGVSPITTAMAGDGAAFTNVLNKMCVWTGSVPNVYAANENVGRAGVNAWGLYDATGLLPMWTLDTDWKADDAGLDPVGYWRTPESFSSDANRRQTMSVDRTIADMRRFVPGFFAGVAVDSVNKAGARFVLNTTDWMADRVK